MEQGQLNWIANFIWGIADDVLRDLYVRGKYRDVILPMTVLRRLDAVIEPTKQVVLDMKASLDKAKITNQDRALRQAAGHGPRHSTDDRPWYALTTRRRCATEAACRRGNTSGRWSRPVTQMDAWLMFHGESYGWEARIVEADGGWLSHSHGRRSTAALGVDGPTALARSPSLK